MFVVTLKFGVNKEKAGQFMQAHNDWPRLWKYRRQKLINGLIF